MSSLQPTEHGLYLMIFIHIYLLYLANSISTSSGTYCDTALLSDIVFLVDESGSVNRNTYNTNQTNFEKQMDFVATFISGFKIGKDGVQIGLVTFSTDVKIEYYLNQYHDLQTLLQKTSKVGYTHPGLTLTNLGMDTVREKVFSLSKGDRPNAKNILIIITDGESNLRTLTAISAKQLHASNVTVFSVGIGNTIDVQELISIASDPENVMTVGAFSNLQGIVDHLQQKLCTALSGTPKPTMVQPISKSSTTSTTASPKLTTVKTTKHTTKSMSTTEISTLTTVKSLPPTTTKLMSTMVTKKPPVVKSLQPATSKSISTTATPKLLTEKTSKPATTSTSVKPMLTTSKTLQPTTTKLTSTTATSKFSTVEVSQPATSKSTSAKLMFTTVKTLQRTTSKPTSTTSTTAISKILNVKAFQPATSKSTHTKAFQVFRTKPKLTSIATQVSTTMTTPTSSKATQISIRTSKSTTTQSSRTRTPMKTITKATIRESRPSKRNRTDPAEMVTELILPGWIRYLELGIIISVVILIIGSVTCCCHRLCCAGSRFEDDDEDKKKYTWRKNVREPMKRPMVISYQC